MQEALRESLLKERQVVGEFREECKPGPSPGMGWGLCGEKCCLSSVPPLPLLLHQPVHNRL